MQRERRVKIKLAIPGGSVTRMIPASWVYGGVIAITINPEHSVYWLTHLGTGYACSPYLWSLGEARLLAEELTREPHDWSAVSTTNKRKNAWLIKLVKSAVRKVKGAPKEQLPARGEVNVCQK